MMRAALVLSGWMLLVVAGDAAADYALSIEELPEPARQTVVREVKGGTILEIERDDDHGATVYEVEFVENQIKYEIDVAPDGALIRRHRD
jgi:uncharacterized membrane protein YkoI